MAKYFPGGIGTVQRPIQYEDPNGEFIIRLERKLSQFIAEKIEDHRFKATLTPFQTRWNRQYSDQIKNQLLITFEQFKYMIRPTGLDSSASPEMVKKASEQLNYIQEVLKFDPGDE